MAENSDDPRFERINESSMVGTSHVRHYSGMGMSIGDLLSRTWALHDPPDNAMFEGFSYVFKDRDTGLIFTAYSAGSGPGFGGRSNEIDKLQSVLDSFEELLSRLDQLIVKLNIKLILENTVRGLGMEFRSMRRRNNERLLLPSQRAFCRAVSYRNTTGEDFSSPVFLHMLRG